LTLVNLFAYFLYKDRSKSLPGLPQEPSTKTEFEMKNKCESYRRSKSRTFTVVILFVFRR